MTMSDNVTCSALSNYNLIFHLLSLLSQKKQICVGTESDILLFVPRGEIFYFGLECSLPFSFIFLPIPYQRLFIIGVSAGKCTQHELNKSNAQVVHPACLNQGLNIN